jgi:asparagine synthetase B (glutamine-hydrolysing)
VSGIVGLLDPGSTADAAMSAVMSAAIQGSGHRGKPEVLVAGPWVLGTISDGAPGCDVAEGPDHVTVADGRIDDVLPGSSVVSRPTGSAADLLGMLLRRAGAEALSRIAGDFAIASFDPGSSSLTLARDAFGIRPLYWARRGGRMGFASDPETLIALGVADGSLDRDAIRAMLFNLGEYGDQTVYGGVRRVMPGRWVTLHADGHASGGRWFRPELTEPDPNLTLEDAGAMTREAILSAVTDRAAGRRAALLLSSGRDSSAVAVALAEAGIKVHCITYVLDAPGSYSEAEHARELASSLGHGWIGISVPPTIPRNRAHEVARIVGRPVNGVGGPAQLALYDAIRAHDVEVVLSGEGGDLLFSAFPVGLVDLLKRGRIGAALSAARAFRREWVYPYSVSAKVVLRAMTPTTILAFRERRRPYPPWLFPPAAPRVRAERSDKEYVRNLMIETSEANEVPERWYEHAGARLSWPLLDLRVVKTALRFPVELRLPDPAPKQVLDQAFLGQHSDALVKASVQPFARALAPRYLIDFPEAYARGSLAVALGLVWADGLGAARESRWGWHVADLAGLEMWLRELEDRA